LAACVVLASAACGDGGGTLAGSGGRGGMGGGGRGGGSVVTGSAGTTGAAGTSAGGSGSIEPNCPAPFAAREVPALVVVVLDASSSMNDDTNAAACSGGCGQSSKWAAAAAAINAVTVETEGRVIWGLELFGTQGTEMCGTQPALTSIAGSTPAIALALQNQSSPNGGVVGGPTRQARGAVDAAISYLNIQLGANPKVIALMTDGAPSCVSGGAPPADDTRGTVDAIVRARTAGYPTFVIGIAAAGGPAHDSMTMMGDAGGLGLATSYVAASSAADLLGALRAAPDAVGGCVFEVPDPPNFLTNRGNIGVMLDGTSIPRDHTHADGWDFVDGTMSAVRLYGPSCDAVNSAQPPSVTIQFHCLAV
jgi:hypothetical protein